MPEVSSTLPPDSGGTDRSSLLADIQKGRKLKKVAEAVMEDNKKNRRHTMGASPKDSGGDLMSALKERMNLRRKGISGARKDEAESAATGDADESPKGFRPPQMDSRDRASTMPNISEVDTPDQPISMAGMANALKAAESNRNVLGSDDDEEEWSDSD